MIFAPSLAGTANDTHRMMTTMMMMMMMMKTQNDHNSDNFEATTSKFCMVRDINDRGGHIYLMEMDQLATSIFIDKGVKYENQPSFSPICPLHLMPLSLSITTNITTDTIDATIITTT